MKPEAADSTQPVPARPTDNNPATIGPLLLVSFAVAGIALMLRTHHLADLSLTFDECCSWKISQFRTADMFDAISRDAHPPLYYLVLKFLTRLFGNHDVVLRGFSVLMGLLSIVACAVLIRTLIPVDDEVPNRTQMNQRRFAVVVGMVLVSLSALQIEMSMEARPYTLGTFLALVAAISLLRATRPGGSGRHWACFTVTTLCLSFTHYYSLFTIAAMYLYAAMVLLQRWKCQGWTPDLKRLLSGILVSLWIIQFLWVLWLPIFRFQLSRATLQLWQPPLNWELFTDSCYRVIAGGRLTAILPIAKYCGLLIWGGVAVWAACHKHREIRLVGMMAVFPFAGAALYGIAVRNIIGVRYLIFAHVFLLVAASLLCARIRRPSVRSMICLLLVGWTGYWAWSYGAARASIAQSQGVMGAVAYLEQKRQKGEPIVAGSPFVHPIVQKYSRHPDEVYTIKYSDHRNNILSGPPLRETDYWDSKMSLEPSLRRIWAVDSYGLFRRGDRNQVAFSGSEWRLESQEEFRERNGLAFILAVRSYVRATKSDVEN